MRRIAMSSTLAIGLAALSGAPASAADVLTPAKIGIVKPGKLAKFVAKDSSLFPLPSGADDPTQSSGSLKYFDTLSSAGSDTYALPAGSWKGLGNPPGAKGFKYKGAGSPSDPCKVVIIKEKVIKAVCKDSGVTLTPPFTGDAGIILASGGMRYCATLGGTDVKNEAGNFKRKDAPAPGACASVSPVCGNGTTEAGEDCDDGNTSNEDTCPADCTIDPCSPTGTPGPIASVNFTVPAGVDVAGLTVFVDYPEGKVSLPGSGASASGAITNTPPGAFAQVNDFDHALREVIASGSAITPGLLFRMNFEACTGAPAPVAGDFTCQVTDASDPLGNTVTGVTCAVTVP
jgi:cysteine-rich repeat protein